MRRLGTLTAIVAFVAAFTLAFGIGPASAFHLPPFESDHALLNGATGDKVWCGVKTRVEPWTLHVSATPGSADGSLKITTRDGDLVSFAMPADSSFSLTHSMGGVPTVDDLVKIEILDGDAGTKVALVSARARKWSRDPFDEAGDTDNPGDAERDNLCLTCQSGTSGDPGCQSAKAEIPY